MPKFRKKPVVVEAEQWFPEKSMDGVFVVQKVYHDDDGNLMDSEIVGIIHTLEGPRFVSPGDWIITGVKGEKYPCKPDIFEQTYEPVEED